MRTFLRLRLSHFRPNPALPRVLPGGRCPLGTPSPAEASCFGSGRRCALRASKTLRLWGAAFRRWGGGRSRGARGVSVCYRNFPALLQRCRSSCRARPAGATLGRVAKAKPCRGPAGCFPRPWERGGKSGSIRIGSTLFRFVSGCGWAPTKTMREFVKHPETLPWRQTGLPAGCDSWQRITADGGDLLQPKPGRQLLPDHHNIRGMVAHGT